MLCARDVFYPEKIALVHNVYGHKINNANIDIMNHSSTLLDNITMYSWDQINAFNLIKSPTAIISPNKVKE